MSEQEEKEAVVIRANKIRIYPTPAQELILVQRMGAFLHGITTGIARRFSVAAIEDLNVEGMKQNRRLAKSISDAGFREFRRQLEYKMPGRVLVVDRFFPSSKLCSTCGHAKTKLPLSVRRWTCEKCGAEHDRDLNAAINLVRAIHPKLTPAETGALGPVVEAGRDVNHG